MSKKTCRRYCRKCKKETLHVICPKSGIVEKVFMGIVTMGMIPLIESCDPDKSKNRVMGAEVICDVCGNVKEET